MWRRDEKPNPSMSVRSVASESVKTRLKQQLDNERLQQKIEDELRMLSEERKEDGKKRHDEESLNGRWSEREREAVNRRQENLKRLQLEVDLCRRRDELFNYRLGDKTRLDCFQDLQFGDVTQLRIGVFGPPGSGKSCFIKTCERVLRLTNQGFEPVSTTIQADMISVQEYLPGMAFRLVDFRGVWFSNMIEELNTDGDGKLKPNAGTDKEKRQHSWLSNILHGIILVFKANDMTDENCTMMRGLIRYSIQDILENTGIVFIFNLLTVLIHALGRIIKL